MLLALETATRVASVALVRGDDLVAEVACDPERSAAEGVLPAVDAALREAGAALADVSAFAVSVGPGSFTSLRVGIATVKGLAFRGGAPVVPVPTLAALALAVPGADRPVVPLLDARRGELYAAAYDPGGALSAPRVAEGVYTPASLAAVLPARCLLVGEGAALWGDEIARALGPGVSRAAASPAARHVAALGALLLARGGAVRAADVVPRYLRRAEAEVKRTGQRFEPGGTAG